MKEYSYADVRARAIERGEARYMYEPIGEELTDPSVWAELPDFYRSHVDAGNARVRELLASHPRSEAFVFFADAHVRQNRMYSVPILRSILENTPVSTVIYGGDTVSAWVDGATMIEDVEYFARAFSFARPYMVRGNHDMYGKLFGYADTGVAKTGEEVYSYLMQANADRVHGETGKNYYWFDSPETRTRYIVVDTNEVLTPFLDADAGWDCNVHVTDAQIDWFIDALSAIPDGYAAVVAGHIPMFSQLRWANDVSLVFGDLIEAYNLRKGLDGEVGRGAHTHRVRADFTKAKGRVVLTVSGHGHYDDLCVTESGCVGLEIHCDAMTDNGGSRYKKVRGTVTENVLDVVILDRATNAIYTVRYGAGVDRCVKQEGDSE